MKEYRVKITVRNNLLLSAIENAGYPTQADFARATGLGTTDVNNLVAMRRCPINHDGEFSDIAKTIMEALGASPSDLWTTEQLGMRLAKNSSDCLLTRFELQSALGVNPIDAVEFQAPDDELFEKEKNKIIADTLDTLTDKEKQILEMRYGLKNNDEETLEKIGKKFGVSGERIKQIQQKALRKLRHPERSDALQHLLN